MFFKYRIEFDGSLLQFKQKASSRLSNNILYSPTYNNFDIRNFISCKFAWNCVPGPASKNQINNLL